MLRSIPGASALVRLVVDEVGTASLKEYFNSHLFRMTSLCFAEAWESLRRSIFIEKRSPKKGYLHQSYLLTAYLREGRIKLDEVSLTDPVMFEDVETIVKKYQIDVSDALQIVTIQKGRYRSFVDESQSLLITADKDLAKAARSEGLKTWCCLGEPIPES